MRLMKNHYLSIAFVVALLVISIMGTYIVMDSRSNKQQVPTPAPTQAPTPSLTPTAIPTAAPTIAPVKKSVNSGAQTRLNELDNRIAAIKQRIADNNAYIDQLNSEQPDGYIYNVIGTQAATKELQQELNTLNAERTQILVN